MELLVADDCPGRRWGLPRMVLEISRGLTDRGHVVDLAYAEPDDLLPAFRTFCRATTRVPALALNRGKPVASTLGLVRSVRLSLGIPHDVVYLHHSSHDVFGAAVGHAQGAPVVCHLHYAPPPRFGLSSVLMTPRIQRHIAVANHVKRQWVAAGLAADRIDVVHNGVDPTRYVPGTAGDIGRTRATLGVGDNETMILYAGRLHPTKGAHVLAGAMSRVARPGWRLVIAGAVDPRPSPEAGEAYARSLLERGPSGTILTGLVTDVVSLYQAADVVVVPTVGDEGLTQVLIEAMSCGTPVLGSHVGGIPEVLTGEFARYLFPPGDPAPLAELLEQVHSWRSDQPGLGGAVREHVRRNFALARTVDGVEASLSLALAEGRAPGRGTSRRRLLRWGRVPAGCR